MEKQRSNQEALDELKKIIAEMLAAIKEQEEKGMSADVYSIYWQFKDLGIKDFEEKASQMDKVPERSLTGGQVRLMKGAERCAFMFETSQMKKGVN